MRPSVAFSVLSLSILAGIAVLPGLGWTKERQITSNLSADAISIRPKDQGRLLQSSEQGATPTVPSVSNLHPTDQRLELVGPTTSDNPRVTCEEQLNQQAGFFAYVKTKMRLDEGQKAIWQDLERAVETVIEDMRNTCSEFPTSRATRLNLLETLDIVDKQLTISMKLIQAIRAPLRRLFKTLTPDQRRILEPSGPPV